jgi:glycine oxidase
LSQRTILIIGGGVIGLSIAEALSRRGIKPIVLEKGDFGREASWAGAGYLSLKAAALAGGSFLDFSVFSLRMFEQWTDLLWHDSGTDPEYRLGPAWEAVFDAVEEEQLKNLFECLQGANLSVEWKTGEEVRKMEAEISPEVFAGIYMPNQGRLRPPRLMRALRILLEKRGVELRDHSLVTGFVVEGGRVKGVKTSQTVISADAVVLAAGAWSGQIGEHAGLKIPVRPLRGQTVLFSTGNELLQSVLSTPLVTLVPRLDGHIHATAGFEDAGFNKNTTLKGLEKIESNAHRVLPGLRLAKMEARWSGLLPGSADDMPFLGPVSGIEGLYLACGHGAHGYLLAPATGLFLDQILRGEETDIPMEHFALNRVSAEAGDN